MYVLTARWILNNYMLGAKLKSAPTHKIIMQNRLDSKKTEVIFASLTDIDMDKLEEDMFKEDPKKDDLYDKLDETIAEINNIMGGSDR